MATSAPPNEVNSGNPNRSTGRIMLGLGLLLPVTLYWLIGLLGPTVQTFSLSFQTGVMLREAKFVGLANYIKLFRDPRFFGALGFTLAFLVVRLVLVAVIPLLLAWAVSRFGRSVRFSVRVLLTIPIVLCIPVAIASVWSIFLKPGTLAEPVAARRILLLIDALYTFGLACGLGLIVYLMVWRRSEDRSPLTFKQVLTPLLITWVIGILATIALTMSSFTLSYIITRGGPGNTTSTLAIWQFRISFMYFKFGEAAVLAFLILLLTLLLGLVVGLLVIVIRLRLVYKPSPVPPPLPENTENPQQNRILPLIVLIVTLLLVIGACFLSVFPFGRVMLQAFKDAAYEQLANQVPIFRVWINTIMPPLLGAIIQVLIAYLGALGIGAIRPFGKHSEWLLFPFCPWLFVTLVPVSLVKFLAAKNMGILNTFVGLIPPFLFIVPLLFIMTLFFRGQASCWQTGRSGKESFFKQMIVPSLPLVGVLLIFLFFIGVQGVFWPMLVTSKPVNQPMSTILVLLRNQFANSGELLATAVTLFTIPIVVFFFPVLVVFQLFYLDRLALRAGAEKTDGG